jgi:glutamyl-tRNA synthetase
MPTYHLANIVDDHLMEISHVIRGEEWLPSLPLHVMLHRSFGWDEPLYAHLPLLLKPTGKGKLSKRDGDKLGFPVFPLYWPHGETSRGYREDGYFPEAFVNMLALLGWNPGTDQEIFSLSELIEAFSLERVGKSGSQFDPEKAKWFNHQYMQSKDNSEIATLFVKELKDRGIVTEMQRVEEIINMVKERATFVTDLWNQADFFFIAPESYDKAVVAKRWDSGSASLMGDLKEVLSSIKDFTSENSESIVKGWIAEKGLSMGVVMNLFRLLIVGESRGPHLFDIIAWLGKEETIRRVERGINRLS